MEMESLDGFGLGFARDTQTWPSMGAVAHCSEHDCVWDSDMVRNRIDAFPRSTGRSDPVIALPTMGAVLEWRVSISTTGCGSACRCCRICGKQVFSEFDRRISR